MSTDEVYGSMKEKTLIPIDESGPMKPTNPYAASKAAAKMLVHAYTVSYNLKSFIVRCNNAYVKTYLKNNSKNCNGSLLE